MVICVIDLVDSCDTNIQGDVVRNAILKQLASSDMVSLDFSGVTNVTSSFINSAIISLMPSLDVSTLKSRIRIKRVNRQIGNMIKDRMASENRMAV